ncbi:hypothetical protein Nos7524_3267 [Nostoc sp. PCC 7524]|uniref:DUF2157 domain-containing protein n=1 Tax=Nostoc sp. (strain ATCC 29411 / PCC 7524) TaxID=28072 RepID=UPI00029F22A9|nr:DUF2157 domain-containing protein [Nostoc sp. PCC 7524]AFY49065.1 hypothetical protein Nos7524_3267 [Nostoc sp. PCC 7524]
MSSPFEHPPQKIELKVSSSHPELLAGLDIWLRLGLISDIQVRQICRDFLTCRVELQPLVEPELQRVAASPRRLEQPLIAYLPEEPKQPKQPARPNVVNQMLQSLGAELSVRWLLFLGVFLVVLSSGVLAASQWERFPAAGQYGVLFAYTLSFWGLSFWAGKQQNLRLTAQTLLIVTLLLVPVNFWAMDSFGLWGNPIDWLTVAIAAPILTIVTVLLCNNRTVINHTPRGKLPLINILGLIYLHWGWQLPLFPLAAIYVAMVGTTILTLYQYRRQQPTPPVNEGEHLPELGINLYATVIIYALLLLLGRGIFVARVDVTQLGLAIGICGWLATWLAQQRSRGAEAQRSRGESETNAPVLQLDVLWQRLGGILLFLGWLVAVFNHPAQALAVSGLALWVVTGRLQRYSLQIDLFLLFLIGLQGIWLGWRLVPSGLQQLAITIGTQLTQSQNEPWALLSVVLFPYLVFMVVVTENLYRANKRDLAHFGEILTLLFGTCLTTIATVNPTLRSLNFLGSTLTLIVVSKRRSPLPLPLVYLTHTMGVLTFCSVINWFLPNLAWHLWASILLVLMLAEWGLSLGDGLWQQSAWHMGFVLAAVSFVLLWTNAESAWIGEINSPDYWGVTWLTTPVALAVMASRTTQHRTANSLFSILAIGTAQLLTLPLPGIRLIGLAVGTGVMYANSRYLRSSQVAGVTIGFGLSLIAALLWEGIPGLSRLAIPGWFVVGAIATFSLWLGRTALSRRNDELARIYAVASDQWAIALCTVELLLMTLHSSLVYQGNVTPGFWYLIATVITLAAIIYRSWQQPTNWAFYGIGWCVELLVAEVLGFGERSIIRIAIANIALGLFSQILGEWWRRKFQLTKLPSSFHVLPLMYGAFSVLLRVNTFTDWSGLASLGVALIFVGVGRRSRDLKSLLYLGIIGISISAYELLFYQMLQASGGGLGDGLIAMAALGTGIMSVYRVLAPWLATWLRLTPQELKGIAHLHWVWSSSLLMAAIAQPIQVNRMVGLGTGAFLITYAILQGKQTANDNEPLVFGRIPAADLWVYLGFFLVAGMRIYWRETAVGQWLAGPLVPWNGAIACVFAYFLYILPWERWGWSKQPWQLAAYIFPLVVLAENRLQVYPITLVIAAGYYVFLAKIGANIRFTYISVFLVDGALFLWFDSLRLNDSLWYVTVIGLSLLYLAQVDPLLRQPENKLPRHTLRLISSGLICGWAILFHQHAPLIPGGFALITIFAGLALRVRAFLYVGTTAFFITSIYQLVIFSLRYPFLKWVVGLLVGITLISIAANFETHRTQITSLLRHTSNEVDEWE